MSEDIEFYGLEDGSRISLQRDPCPENPLSAYGSLGTFYTWEYQRASPTDNPYRTVDGFMVDTLGVEKAAACDTMQEALQALDEAGYAACGIYRYEHGQVSYALGGSSPYGDSWDSGAVGFAFVPPEKLQAEGVTKEQAIACMDGEMRDYSCWANGEVYLAEGYDVEGELERQETFYGIDGFMAAYPNAEPIGPANQGPTATLDPAPAGMPKEVRDAMAAEHGSKTAEEMAARMRDAGYEDWEIADEVDEAVWAKSRSESRQTITAEQIAARADAASAMRGPGADLGAAAAHALVAERPEPTMPRTVASMAKQARAKAEAAKQAKQPAQDAPKHKQQRKG